MAGEDNLSTICFVHGVGNRTAGFSKPLSDRVAKLTGATCIEYIWDHLSPLPPQEGLSLAKYRGLTGEIILDFVRALADLERHADGLPLADMYVGHSAGSLIISLKKVPLVHMGSPLRLVIDEITRISCPRTPLWILNLVCKQDVVAFKMERNEVEDSVFSVPFYDVLGRTIPLMAHSSYWDSQYCADEIARWYRIHFP